jgi:hypothetical protein
VPQDWSKPILTYFVIANPSDAEEVGENFLSDKFVWFDFSCLDAGVLNDLTDILAGRPLKQGLDENDVPPVLYESSSEFTVHQIPNEWLNAIADIDVRQIPDLVKELTGSSVMLHDWVNDGVLDSSLIEENLTGLRDICCQARTKKIPLLILVGA